MNAVKMNKGGKRHFNKKKSGNWFIHNDLSQTAQSDDLCSSTGSVLANGDSQPAEERYPKIFINCEKKNIGREYPLSVHDNRSALQKTIDVYDQGLGRKKCLDERRQQNSHFHLCHQDTLSPASTVNESHSVYRSDFLSRQEAGDRKEPIRRRFPRDYSARSQMNAQVQECFMWFARNDSNQYTPLSVLADSNHALTK